MHSKANFLANYLLFSMIIVSLQQTSQQIGNILYDISQSYVLYSVISFANNFQKVGTM